jgi:CxxC-x17-CxxC domain-containing protein
MATHILHLGAELSDRFSLLRAAGYSINRYETMIDFRQALQSGTNHDALSLTDLEVDESPLFVQTARAHSPAPLILFRTGKVIQFPAGNPDPGRVNGNARSEFDLVVPAAASLMWISDVHELIARNRDLRDQSYRLREKSMMLLRETAPVIEKARFNVERARLEGARNYPANAAPPFIDKVATCRVCGGEFVFTAAEQFFFRLQNFINDPKVCKRCRTARRNGGHSARPDTAVTCAGCGVLTTVPFKPVQGRPVLCRPCFERSRKAV